MNAIPAIRTSVVTLVIVSATVASAAAPTCTDCKASFPETYKYCPFCGHALATAAEAIQAGAGTPDMFTNSVGMQFKLIRPGSFVMGCEDGYDNEVPRHKVTLTRAFYMDTHEVTQQQYEKIMGANPSHFTGANRPVDSVPWEKAVAFCKKLSDKEGRHYRLPSEAEWEYACRAGTTTDFYWGEDFDDRFAWIDQNSGLASHDTGTRLPNPWGLYDMNGNVAEWCADWYALYATDAAAQTDPTGPSPSDTIDTRVLRGGSWKNHKRYCRCSDREDALPDRPGPQCGFRVVLEPAPAAPGPK